jgi:hypothetical protein
MSPKIWGPKYWKLFHIITTYYPENPTEFDKKKAIIMLKSIYNIIPCGQCARHYRANIGKFGLRDALKSRDNFVIWFVKFHNFVSKSVGNKQIPHDIALNKVNDFRKNCNLINVLNDFLSFTKFVLPNRGIAQQFRKTSIMNFLRSISHFTKLDIDIKQTFTTRFEFILFKNKLINKCRNQSSS